MELRLCLSYLDNSLIAWNNPDGIQKCVNGYMTYVMRDSCSSFPTINMSVSNGQLKNFGIEFEAFALKPFTFGINRALKRFNVQPHEVVMIGDQLMTDIRAAKRVGLKSVLVKPLIRSDSI